jgi:hypothetical protein
LGAALPALSGLVFLVLYVGGLVAVVVYVILLLRRHAIAQERIAAAIVHIAEQTRWALEATDSGQTSGTAVSN